MEYLSIPQMAAKLGISDNTVRRYVKRFKDCLPSPVKAGIVFKYPESTTEMIRKVYAWYEKGLSKTEIISNLQSGYDDTTPTAPPQPDKFDVLGSKIDALTAAITGLTTLFMNNATALPAPGQTIEAIAGMGIKLLADPILTPSPQPDMEPPPEKTEIKTETETPTTPTPTEKVEPDTTTPPTGRTKKGKSLKKPKKSGVKTPATTPPPTGGDATPTGHVTPDTQVPDMKTDKEGYKRDVIKLIVKLKGQGMIFQQIKAELEGRGLKTFRGKDAWAISTIGNLYNKNK